MSHARQHAVPRRLALLVLGVLAVGCLVGSVVALPATTVAQDTATAVADTAPESYDRSLHADECDLLGRAFVTGHGCARSQCLEGAVPWRKVAGAEACSLADQPKGFGFASTVDAGHCLALHRRWIPQVNYCASQPDRSVPFVRNAPQCTGPTSVYVNLDEVEGHYDECLTPDRVDELLRVTKARGTTLAGEVALRSGAQCQDRPGHAFVGGRCTRQPGLRRTAGGVLMIGDSVTWRGSDELTRLQPGFTVDGEPARRPTELGSRLDAFRARHGQPTGLIVELGTNPAVGFDRSDLAAVVRTLPAATPVMFVLPYVETSSDPVIVSEASVRFDGWMRSVAASRAGSCLADWPAYVRAHPGLLQDGTHTWNAAEGDWARWISDQWETC